MTRPEAEFLENGEAVRDGLKRRPLISIVVPVYNEEGNVDRLYDAVTAVFSTSLRQYDHEIIFTDNHSEDRSFERIAAIAARDPRVRVARFARNFGFHRSVLTGYRLARGDAAIQIDCDLQDSPELFVEFLRLWEAGHDVVVGVRSHREEGPLLRYARHAFYEFMNRISEENLVVDGGDFRLVDRHVLDQLKWINDVDPYTRGLTSSLARNQIGIPYERRAREVGESKYPVRKLIGLALEGVLTHSVAPLRVASFVGLIVASCCVALALFYALGRLILDLPWPNGFATLSVLMLFGIGMNAIFLGIIGEYLGRLHRQSQRRPVTIIERAVNITGEDAVSWPTATPPLTPRAPLAMEGSPARE